MLNINEDDIDRITAVFHLILKGKKPSAIDLPLGYPDNEMKQAVEYINRFISQYNAVTDVCYALAKGDNSISLPKGNMAILSSFKSLQASLQHLTWTTQQIAAGDFKQRVDFMGDFSEAFNSMVQQLDRSSREHKKVNADLQNRIEELAKARRAMLNIMEDLQESRKEAEAATKAKGDFLANMSHEIRTPMNAIIGLSHLVLKTELDNKQYDYMSKIYKSAKSLLGIINDILDFSKIEAGKLDIESIDFDLNEVIYNVSNIVSVKTQEKGLELNFSMDTNLFTDLIGDPLRLGQILLNLANNAVKFTDQGEILVTAEQIEETSTDVLIKFSVKDTGLGLTSDQTQHLFQSFHQADTSTTRKYGGTGLGLTISKQLSEMMGGTIGVVSEHGKGSTFYFTARMGKQKTPRGKRIIIPEYLQALDVLVVDDNATSRAVLKSHLEGFSFSVSTADSGYAAIEILQKRKMAGEKPFGLILMDWQMPGMDGIETSRRILKDASLDPKPKIIMVTAYGREDAMQQANEAGLNGFLLKPVTESMIFNAVVETFGETKGPVKARRPKDAEIVPEGFDDVRGARLYLVEDNEINRQVAVELLQDEGFFVDIAENGKIAVDHITQMDLENRYDLILMDLQMPVMGGIDAARKIRQWETEHRVPPIPILAMTADAMTGVREKVLDAGMDDYLTKPIEPLAVFRALVNWIKPGKRSLHNSYRNKKHASDTMHATEINIPDLPGIDTAMGLSRVNNKKTLYLEILEKFVDQFGDFDRKIKQLIDDNDLKTAHRLAHTLKGVAGNIGALRLKDTVAALEKGLKEKNPSDLSGHLAGVRPELEIVLTGVMRSGLLNLIQTTETEPAAGPVDIKALSLQLNELKQVLAKSIPRAARELIKQIKTMPLPDTDRPVYAEMETMIKKYKFKDALNLVTILLDKGETQTNG